MTKIGGTVKAPRGRAGGESREKRAAAAKSKCPERVRALRSSVSAVRERGLPQLPGSPSARKCSSQWMS